MQIIQICDLNITVHHFFSYRDVDTPMPKGRNANLQENFKTEKKIMTY